MIKVVIEIKDGAATANLSGFETAEFNGVYSETANKICFDVCREYTSLEEINEDILTLCVEKFPAYAYECQKVIFTNYEDINLKIGKRGDFGKSAVMANKFEFRQRYFDESAPRNPPECYKIYHDDKTRTVEYRICDNRIIVKRY